MPSGDWRCWRASQAKVASGGTIEVLRRNVFVDTTLVHPAVIRAAVDLVGVDNVLAGSDFPIVGVPFAAR
jgi:hypothetical protein